MNRTSKGVNKVKNVSGNDAYRLDSKTKLVTMALTTMINEPKCYGDNTDELVRLAEALCKAGEGEFVAKLAVWARTEANLRTVSHVLLAICGKWCHGDPSKGTEGSFVRAATRIVASRRADDGTEIVASYLSMYGKPLPNAIRRGVADALGSFNAHQLAKYRLTSKEVKLRDVLRLTHPVPRDENSSEAMGGVIDGTLNAPSGWETEISARGNVKEVWDELLADGKVGIFAMVRNMRNIIQSGADVTPVIEALHDRNVVSGSRMLPFRFLSAYRELYLRGLCTKRVIGALDAAMGIACDGIEWPSGRTAVLVDSSGSMGYPLSTHSSASILDVAACLASMVARLSDDVIAIRFSGFAEVVPVTGASLIADIMAFGSPAGMTSMEAAFNLLDATGFDADRVIVLSDNEVNYGKVVVQRRLDDYRRKVGHDVWCHAIDLQGYGTSQFIGDKVQVLAGWSERILEFVRLSEEGHDTLVSHILSIALS